MFGTAYGKGNGIVEIRLDGKRHQSVDLCKPNTKKQPLFANINIALPNDGALHSLEIRSSNSTSPYCAKSKRGFGVDHFEVYP